jgi:DNA polymerase-3 subunit gamma/tau
MSYLVLARKWRPRSFEQVVGQGHVLRVLINALNQGRLHHAYLFTGTRGVGKTTLARILAKCLNCEAGVSAKPCGECSACREIDEGRFVDLLEVDAASRTKVEDTRELLDNVQYAPARGRYKIYLIDEVHMLSGHSFNALLKTLEEPPPHVKFLLATTDPQKLPITVLSRCLQFNLKRLSAKAIATYLGEVLQQEEIVAETPALDALAWAADGSMRDALSLLDQAIAYGDGRVAETEVNELLGSVPREHLQVLINALMARDAGAVMGAAGRLAEQAVDFAEVLSHLITVLHHAALAQAVPGLAQANPAEAQASALLAQRLSPEEVQLYYQIALTGRRDLPLAPEPRTGFEMVLLRMLSFRPAAPARRPTTAAPASFEPAPPPPTDTQPAQALARGPSTGQTAPARPVPSADGDLDWAAMLRALPLKGVAFALASNCSLKSRRAGEVCLVLGQAHAELRTQNAEWRLQKALGEYFSEDLRLRIEIDEHASETPAQVAQRHGDERQRAAEQAIHGDAGVQDMMESFGATIVPGSITPLDKR